MKIWLDDLRVAPDGYETAKSVNEAIDLIEECEQNGEEIEVWIWTMIQVIMLMMVAMQ